MPTKKEFMSSAELDIIERLDAIEAQQTVIIDRLEDISEKLDNLNYSGDGFGVVEGL